jgi:FKBP-type peptidyl-prolyl cis-trans isomerase
MRSVRLLSALRRTPIASCVLLACLGAAACSERDVSVSETPIKVLSESLGHGPAAREGDTVTIAYRISLPTGGEVLHDEEFTFVVGGDGRQLAVIGGIDQAVRGMSPGGTRLIDCPPQHHWGRAGYADRIPPNTNLLISLRMYAVQ